MAARVFITGISGCIGSTLARRYRSQDVEVVGVDLAAPADDARVVLGDVTEPGPWQEAAAGSDLVIHTAAHVGNTAPLDLCWKMNVLSVRHALDAAVAGGAQRFVHLSSVRAFSDVDFPDGVDERHPVRPDGHRYVDTKVASEQVALQAHSAGEVPCTVIRPGDVYGPGSVPWTGWPAMGIPTGTFAVPSEGGVFSPVFVENLVDGITAAAGSPAGAGQVFTISDGVGMPNEEFFGRYADMLGVPLPSMPADELRAVLEAAGIGGETVDYFLRRGTYSIDKARTMLGYQPAVGIDEGMERSRVWLVDQGLVSG
jgi:nucleoside-diphosphate-sugar epimerase